MNKPSIIETANATYRCIHGAGISTYPEYKYNPFGGYDPNVLSRYTNLTDVQKMQAEYEEKLLGTFKEKAETSWKDLPVIITKGGKEKKGLEGWVLHEQQSLHATGKALLVFDPKNQRDCWAADHAVKLRVPAWDEYESVLLKEISESQRLAPLYKRGMRVALKSDPSVQGVLMYDCSLPNWSKDGLHQCRVQWFANADKTANQEYFLPQLLQILN